MADESTAAAQRLIRVKQQTNDKGQIAKAQQDFSDALGRDQARAKAAAAQKAAAPAKGYGR